MFIKLPNWIVICLSLAAVAGLGLSALADGQSGTTLTAYVTATGHLTTTQLWTINKSANPSILDLSHDSNGTVTYTISVNQNGTQNTISIDQGLGATGLNGSAGVCVNNGGAVDTQGLQIVLQVTQPPSTTVIASVNVDVSAYPVLHPGETYCYPYSVTSASFIPGSSYKITANITITNHSGHLGTPWGPSPSTNATIPSSSSALNSTIHVNDSNGQSFTFSASDSQQYSKTFAGDDDCEHDENQTPIIHNNTATIQETGQSASAAVTVNCTTPQQFTLTVTASPAGAQGGTFTLAVSSGSCTPGNGTYTMPQNFSCNSGSQVTVSNPQSPVPTSPTNTRYLFSSFSPGATVTVNAATTITLNYTTQFLVGYAVSGCSLSVAPPASEWVNSGGTASGSFQTQVTSGGTRCNFVSDNRPSNITGPTTVTGTYQIQYLLIVNNGGFGTTSGQSWYDSGSTANFSINPTTVSVSAGEQALFNGWSGDSTSPNASSSITMSGPKTVTATWLTQYLVSYVQTGCQFSVSLPPSEWVNSGSNASGNFPTPVAGTGTQCLLQSTTPAGPINGPTTRTGTYQTQYLVTYTASGCALSVTMPSEWVNSGGSATTSFPTQVVNGAGDTRCTLVSDNRPATITGLTTVTATYQSQYLLTVNNGGHGTAGGQGWNNSGTTANFSIGPTTVAGGPGEQFLFNGWTGDSTSPNASDSILMSGPKAVMAMWQTQYQVSYTASGCPFSLTMPSSQWINSGGSATGSFPAQVTNGAGNTRCNFVSDNRPATITGPTTVTGTYQTQYLVFFTQSGAVGTVDVQFNGSHPMPYSDFFNAGSNLGPFQYDSIVGQFYCQSNCSGTIGVLNGPQTITADYLLDNTPPTLTCARLTPPNAFGWNNTDVKVHFVADDSGSGLAEAGGASLTGAPHHYEFDETITGEGTNLSVSATAKDRVGNEATATCTANIDRTPPTIVATVSPAPDSTGVVTTDGPVTVIYSCSDALSGVASCPPPSVLTADGSNTMTVQTVDKAGNVATTTVNVVINRPIVIQAHVVDQEIPPPGEEMTVQLIFKSVPQGLNRYDIVFHSGGLVKGDTLARIESVTSKTIDPTKCPLDPFKVVEQQDFFVRFKASNCENWIKPGDINVVFAEVKLRILLPGQSIAWMEIPTDSSIVDAKGRAIPLATIKLIFDAFAVPNK